MLKLLSWNCQYQWDKKAGLTLEKMDAVSRYEYDVLLIQECTKGEFDRVKGRFRYRNWYGDDREDSVLGTAIFSNTAAISFPEAFNRNFRYVIPYTLAKDGRELTLYAVWIKKPSDGSEDYAKVLFEAMEYYRPQKAAVVMGDFNIGSNAEHPERYIELIKVMGEQGFLNSARRSDLKHSATHWNKGTRKYYQNDYCFTTGDIKPGTFEIPEQDQWREVDSGLSWAGLSDHCPIGVGIEF